MRLRTQFILFALIAAGAAQISFAQHAPIDKDATETSAANLHDLKVVSEKLLVIDVREPKEFETGHVPGAVNIPIGNLAKKIQAMDVPKDTTIVTVCEHGGRSSRAAVELKKLGYKTTSFCRLDGWKEKGYEVENGDGKPKKVGGVYKFTCHHYCQAEKETADLDEMCECACNKPFRDCMRAE